MSEILILELIKEAKDLYSMRVSMYNQYLYNIRISLLRPPKIEIFGEPRQFILMINDENDGRKI